jgi:hypothetical protein
VFGGVNTGGTYTGGTYTGGGSADGGTYTGGGTGVSTGGTGGGSGGTSNVSCGLVFKTVCTPPQQCVFGWSGYNCEVVVGENGCAPGLVLDDFGGCTTPSSGVGRDQKICQDTGGVYDSASNWCSCPSGYNTENGQCVYSTAEGKSNCETANSDGIIGVWNSATNECTWDYVNGSTGSSGCAAGLILDEFGGCTTPNYGDYYY